MTSSLRIVGQGEVLVGKRTKIESDVQFIFHRPAVIAIGDYCVLGSGVKFVSDGGDIKIGDWTSIHDRSLLLSTKGLVIGQHSWFGQHCVIDGTGYLSVGNGVRVGMYSQIWSHVAAGEQIEGCTLFGTRPVYIEDNVWLVGSCIVASGVTIGKRTIALIGSNITKSSAANSVLAGSPAAIKEKLSFYKELSFAEKWKMLLDWLVEISKEQNLAIVESNEGVVVMSWASLPREEYIIFAANENAARAALRHYPNSTVCNLQTKKYTKRLTDLEALILKLLAGNKARFYS
jgi:acetyltransferase-like isoleucine patch superfamily enzyme